MPFIGKHSAETRAKMSAGNKGRVVSAETRAKIGAAQKLRHKLTMQNAAIAANLRLGE